MNPNHEVTSVGRRQLAKKLPRFEICLQRFSDVHGQVGDYRSRRVGVVRRRRRQTGRGEQAGRLEFRPPFAIDVRPLARGLSRCDLEGVSVVIETFTKKSIAGSYSRTTSATSSSCDIVRFEKALLLQAVQRSQPLVHRVAPLADN